MVGVRRHIAFLACLLALLLPSITAAQDAPRHALIIANKDYADEVGALNNPHKDADVIRQALIAAGFAEDNIEIIRDKSRIEILSAIERYAARLAEAGPNAIGLFYYSGHGAAKPNTNENYIIPVTVTDAGSSTLWFESISLETVRRLLRDIAPRAAHLVIFDACRNELRLGRNLGKGFVPSLDWGGMLIAYSTDPGEIASDGARDAPAGPYALALAEELQQARGGSASELFENVRFKVRARAGGQAPWFVNGLDARITFGDAERSPHAEQDNGANPQPPLSEAAQAWRAVQDTRSEAVLERFIREFPGSVYAGFAEARLEELRNQQVAVGIPEQPAAAQPQPSCDGVEVSLGTGGTQCVKPGSGESFKDCGECPEMVAVPAGGLMMGSPEDEEGRLNFEGSRREVTIAQPFAVGKFEITVSGYLRCVAAGKCRAPEWQEAGSQYNIETGTNDHYKKLGSSLTGSGYPIVGISWDDAVSFVKYLSEMTGKPYRLLTEAEWEYAARADTTTRYSFGDSETTLGDYAWFSSNSGSKTQAVGGKKPNGWGLHDVHGNVWEWVQDCYADSYKDAPRDGSAAREASGCARVLRGGSWSNYPLSLRSAFRNGRTPVNRNYSYGFRVARTL